MNPITFCGESSGGIAVRNKYQPKPETSGGVGVTKPEQDEIVIQEPEQDEVCFRASNYSEKKSSVLPTLTGITFTAAGVIATLGYAKKYNWLEKISNQKVRDFVAKYGAEPSYKACSYIKSHVTDGYNHVVKFFKG